MKSFISLLVISVNFFACDFGSLNDKAKSESDNSGASPIAITDVCKEKEEDYQHKSEAELAAMTPAQLIDEKIKHELYHMPAGGQDGYQSFVIWKYIRDNALKVMPVLTVIANEHNPTSRCEEMRFFVAFSTASSIDGVVIRLRGTKEGLSTIKALEGSLRRMAETGFDNEQKRRDYAAYMGDLKRLQGRTINDDIIRDTLRLKHNVQMSEEELIEFSNFLTALDPTYPSWSEMGEYSVPMVLKDSKRYYEAYLKFKTKK